MTPEVSVRCFDRSAKRAPVVELQRDEGEAFYRRLRVAIEQDGPRKIPPCTSRVTGSQKLIAARDERVRHEPAAQQSGYPQSGYGYGRFADWAIVHTKTP